MLAQTPTPEPKKEVYDNKEEILHRLKRYRLHNNYLTFGGGFMSNSRFSQSQKHVAADFVFHVREQHYSFGVMMSGYDYFSNNQVQMHGCYVKRFETATYNLAFFGGPSYHTGVQTYTDSTGIKPLYYNGVGLYFGASAVTKLAYDIGIGMEVFGDVSLGTRMFGFRLVAFFSGAYRGPKQNFNPHVRSENPR